MNRLNRISDTVRGSLDVLAEGWQELWSRTKHAITRFTPASGEDEPGGNRWGLLSAELHEGKDSITVAIEAPGMNKEDFEILVNDQTLAVRGARQASRDRTEGRYHITERVYGRFERLIPLPVEVDREGARASYRSGVLTVELPRSRAVQPRIIAIE